MMKARSIAFGFGLLALAAPSFAILPAAPLVGELLVAGRVGGGLVVRELPRAGVATANPTVQAALAALGMGVVMGHLPSQNSSVRDQVQTAKDAPLPSPQSPNDPNLVKRYVASGISEQFSTAQAAANARVALIYQQNNCSTVTNQLTRDQFCPTSASITLDTYSSGMILYSFTTNATVYSPLTDRGSVSCSDGSAVIWDSPKSPRCAAQPQPEQPDGKCDVQISLVSGAYVLNRRAADPDCATDTGSVISPDAKSITQSGLDVNGNPLSIKTTVNPDGGTTTTVSTQTSSQTASGTTTSVETTNITTNAAGNVTNYNTTINNNSSITNTSGSVVNNAPPVPVSGTVSVDLPNDYARENTLNDVKTNTKNIENTLKGDGIDNTPMSSAPINQLDEVYRNFNDKISQKIGKPVGDAFSFSFGLPVAIGCVPLSWNVHGYSGVWDYCPEWESVGRPVLAFFFYALTAFFIFDAFAVSGRGK